MYSPCGKYPEDLFWVLSILWLICQIIDWLRNGKK